MQTSGLGVLFVVLLALQVGFQPIVQREYIREGADTTAIVLATEAIKFCISLVGLFLSGSFSEALKGWSLRDSFNAAGAAATVYAFQNLMIQTAYQNMDGLTFNMLNQSKTIFTAIFLYTMLGNRQSKQQMAALCGMLVASVLLSQNKGEVAGRVTSFRYGVLPCIGASVCSGFASAVSQLALQGRKRNSFVFTMELAVFSVIVLFATTLVSGKKLDFNEMYSGWRLPNMIPIFTSGIGGVLVGFVMKYAGGVRRGFAIVMGIMLTAVLQYFLYGAELDRNLMIGFPLVAISTIVHIMYPVSVPDAKKKKQ
eukprot:m.228262 g.228262  ORF g.228262 m.228262 type:complete len:311 (+) comp15976_c1_seq25:295-1227(+)